MVDLLNDVQDLVSLGGHSFDKPGYIVVGPLASRHLMEVLHKTAGNHMGARKLLVKFHERHVMDGNQSG